MARYILREMPDIRREGRRKVYPQLVTYSRKSLDDLAQYIMRHGSPYDPSIITGVLIRLEDALVDLLADSNTVKIDGLGTFSLSLQFADEKETEMKDDDDRMGYRRVEVRTLNFRPDDEIMARLRQATHLERGAGGVFQFRRSRFPAGERLDRALSFIAENGFITLSQYAQLNGLSNPVASRDLKTLTADPACPITPQGRPPHRIWVMKRGEEEIQKQLEG